MKVDRIIIKCSPKTKEKWKKFVLEGGFRDYEEALNFLLAKAKVYSWLERGEIY